MPTISATVLPTVRRKRYLSLRVLGISFLVCRFFCMAGPGAARQRLWSTFPGRILAFICSGGKRPTELLSIDTPENRQKIDAYVIHDSSQILDHLENADDNDYQTVVLDQVTNMQGLLLKEHLGLNDIPAVRNWGMATDADWGNVNAKTIEICRELLNFSGNAIIVAHERIHAGREDVSGDTNIIHPHMSVAATPGARQSGSKVPFPTRSRPISGRR